MKERILAMMAAIMVAATSAGCQQTKYTRDKSEFFAPETPSGETVETDISEMGRGTTVYAPPEKTVLDFGKELGRYIYQYTAIIPMNNMPVDMGGLNFDRVQYYYADENHDEYKIILDQYDRVLMLKMMDFERTEGWIVEELTEENFMSMADELMEILGIPLSYDRKSFSENNLGYYLYFIRKEDTPLETRDMFHFDDEGRFLSVSFDYDDIEEISQSDENYFNGTLDNYLKKHPVSGQEVERNVHYGVYNRVLVATFTVIWEDPDGARWAETYFAGKPF